MISILAPSAAKLAAAGGADAAAAAAAFGPDASASSAAVPGPPDALASADAPASLALWAAAVAQGIAALPNSCFEPAPPPPHPGYSLPQRAAAAAWTAALYGALGLACGGAGQARAHTQRVCPSDER
jgi:hypothetical protein